MKLKINSDYYGVVGIILCFVAFVLVTTGGGVTWGITGALWSSGVFLGIMGVGFLAAASND